MPRIRLTKSAIDALPTGAVDTIFWDQGCPGFGVKVTPKGRKVFTIIALPVCRAKGSPGSRASGGSKIEGRYN
jgi:hypothetical protein